MEIGEKIRFTPHAFIRYEGAERQPATVVPVEVTGIIDYINAPHRWYRVRYDTFGVVSHEGFKY